MSFTKLNVLVLTILLLFSVFAGVVSAQEEEEATTQITLGDNLKATGIVGVFLALLSIAMVAFITCSGISSIDINVLFSGPCIS